MWPNRQMTRQQFRKWALDHGVMKPGDDVHVFHIISNSNGGADHGENFMLMSAKFNLDEKDKFDPFNVYLVGVDRAKRAIEVSMEHGTVLDNRGKPTKYYQPKFSSDPLEEATRL